MPLTTCGCCENRYCGRRTLLKGGKKQFFFFCVVQTISIWITLRYRICPKNLLNVSFGTGYVHRIYWMFRYRICPQNLLNVSFAKIGSKKAIPYLRAYMNIVCTLKDTLFDLCDFVLSVSEFHENRHERVRCFLTTITQLLSRAYRKTTWHFEDV
jgi:hypothetical protein